MSRTDRDKIPFGAGWLPAYRFRAEQSPTRAARGTVVVFGGFDSYIEELFAITDGLCAAGWDVVAFEAPGQGGALEEAGLPFVVDHYAEVREPAGHLPGRRPGRPRGSLRSAGASADLRRHPLRLPRRQSSSNFPSCPAERWPGCSGPARMAPSTH
jgi:hypothetical protein